MLVIGLSGNVSQQAASPLDDLPLYQESDLSLTGDTADAKVVVMDNGSLAVLIEPDDETTSITTLIQG